MIQSAKNSPKIFTHTQAVRFCDLDSLGHINNAIYLSYVELCRIRWIEKCGLCPSEQLHAIPFILARASTDFILPGKLNDTLEVSTWISHIGNKSFTMEYEINSLQRGLLARSQAVLVWYDYQTNCSVEIPHQFREKLKLYFL